MGVSAVPFDGLGWIISRADRLPEETIKSDTGLLVREIARTGDEDLFQLLVQRFRDQVFWLAVSVLGPGREADAEDVVQEVFVTVYRKITTFRHESGFSTWLYRVTRNRAIDVLRSARVRHTHVEDDTLRSTPRGDRASNPEVFAAAGQRRAAVLRHVRKLSDLQRTVVYLHYWNGCTVTEISSLLEMNPQTVKSHLHRARRRLARMMEAEDSGHA